VVERYVASGYSIADEIGCVGVLYCVVLLCRREYSFGEISARRVERKHERERKCLSLVGAFVLVNFESDALEATYNSNMNYHKCT
jgi:hypothetical protein